MIYGNNMQQIEIRSVLDSETYVSYAPEPLKLLDSKKEAKSRNRYYCPHFSAEKTEAWQDCHLPKINK